VQDIDRNVSAIVESAREQAAGIRSIGQAVNTLDRNIQQNAATVEEQSASSHDLAGKAAELSALLGRFRVTGETGPAAHAVPRRRVA
jgi:methyl-accepting chemotaxis protein